MALRKKRWAVFISGRGSNLCTFLDSQNEIDLRLVVSSQKKAYGLVRSQRLGVNTFSFDGVVNWDLLEDQLRHHQIDFIFLAGFMKILPAAFLKNWRGQIFNIHPSLLPKYPGLASIARAFEAGDDLGASVHEVIPEVDQGKILAQKIAVSKEKIDRVTLSQASFYVHTVEHSIVRKWVRQWPAKSLMSS